MSRPYEEGALTPLKLPKDGEELLPGRQYEIDPVARAFIINHYGIITPRFVECIKSASPARRVTITTEYADGRPTRTTHQDIPAQDATFRAFYKYKRIALFTLDLTVIEYNRQFYVDAPVEPDDIDDEGEPAKYKNKKEPKPTKPLISVEDLMKL